MCNHELEKRHSEKEQFLEFGAVYNLNIDIIKSDRPTIFQVGEDFFSFTQVGAKNYVELRRILQKSLHLSGGKSKSSVWV